MPDPKPDQFDAQTLIELGRLAAQIGNNPKTRRTFMKALKEIDPDRYARFPDQKLEDKLEELDQARETEKIEREAEKLQVRRQAQRDSLAHRYSEEDIGKIEALMQANGLVDYEVGAKIYAADTRPASPNAEIPRPSATWTLPTFEGLAKDPANAARNHAYAVIDELRKQR
jgi:hypothetical protein